MVHLTGMQSKSGMQKHDDDVPTAGVAENSDLKRKSPGTGLGGVMVDNTTPTSSVDGDFDVVGVPGKSCDWVRQETGRIAFPASQPNFWLLYPC
jgi:hypothetical protein